jgi:hypothetical protein
MTLPTLLSRMLLRLYDLRFFVRNAFSTIGSILNAKIIVEIVPAMIGKFIFIAAASESASLH